MLALGKKPADRSICPPAGVVLLRRGPADVETTTQVRRFIPVLTARYDRGSQIPIDPRDSFRGGTPCWVFSYLEDQRMPAVKSTCGRACYLPRRCRSAARDKRADLSRAGPRVGAILPAVSGEGRCSHAYKRLTFCEVLIAGLSVCGRQFPRQPVSFVNCLNRDHWI